MAVSLLFFPSQVYAEPSDVEEARMELMRTRASSIRFRWPDVERSPSSLQPQPLFRYDDVPRGYVDGSVWRLGQSGRPLAIITTELNPKYLGTSPRVVYDFLSLSEHAFSATSDDVSWTPSGSAVTMQPLTMAPKPAETASKRLFQMKRIMQGFSARQVVSEENPETTKLSLRLLPRPIDRYVNSQSARSDGAVFLFVAGRMPGVIVFLETDGKKWQYGVGRLSAPSTLTVSIDGENVWIVPPKRSEASRRQTSSGMFRSRAPSIRRWQATRPVIPPPRTRTRLGAAVKFSLPPCGL
jgi:hypothetical protein